MARVFLVEDAAGVQEFVVARLQRAGHEVVGAEADPGRAAGAYLALRPDVCVVDVATASGSGLAALRAIRAVDGRAEVIACTAAGGSVGVLEAIRAGAHDVVGTVLRLESALERLDARAAEAASFAAGRGAGPVARPSAA
jgi:two-component system chemotaxis response regulator CheY